MRHAILRSSLLLVLPVLLGCPSGATTIEPIYEIDPDHKVVVIPFKEPDFASRWDSPTGNEMAEQTTKLLNLNADFEVIPYRKVIELYGAPKTDVRTLKPRDVANLTDADYVVVCDVTRWDPLEAQGVGITQANARAKAKLFKVERRRTKQEDDEADERLREQNAARDKIGLEQLVGERGGDFVIEGEVEARYPDTFLEQDGVSFMDPEEARAGLMRALSREVAQLWYEHEEAYKKHRGR